MYLLILLLAVRLAENCNFVVCVGHRVELHSSKCDNTVAAAAAAAAADDDDDDDIDNDECYLFAQTWSR